MSGYSARCSFPGCESGARPNPADLENGPGPADLDPVLCPYHEAELDVISHLELDSLEAVGVDWRDVYWSAPGWGDLESLAGIAVAS